MSHLDMLGAAMKDRIMRQVQATLVIVLNDGRIVQALNAQFTKEAAEPNSFLCAFCNRHVFRSYGGECHLWLLPTVPSNRSSVKEKNESGGGLSILEVARPVYISKST